MKIIINTRGSGKSKQLLEIASKTENGVVLTQNKQGLQVKAKNYGFNNLKIIDYDDLEHDRFPLDAILFVHNGDKMLSFLLQHFYSVELGGFTATMEDN